MRSRRSTKRNPGARGQRKDDSTASELLLLQTSHEELLRDDSELLLSAVSRFLCDDSTSSSAFAFPPINDFPSFQALLQAATTVVTVDNGDVADPSPQPAAHATTARANTHTQKRRERNRISCRKTRLKRKVEQANEDLVAAKRAEHNQFLSELHHELIRHEQHGLRDLESERAARELVVRSLHFQLMDPEYDASWCFELGDGDRRARGRNPRDDANQALLDQWQAIVAELENANLEILQVCQQNDNEDSSLSRCQWRLVGLSKQQLQNGRVEKVVVAGVTNVRFINRSIESIDMQVI